MPTVSSVMTKNPVVCVVPGNVESVVKTLTKKGLTGMPVVNADGKYAGVISRRDIFSNHEEAQTAMVMRSPVPVREDEDVSLAAKQMVDQGKRHIAIVDANNKVVGIVTPQNLLKIAQEKYGEKKISEVQYSRVIPIWEKTPLKVMFNVMNISSIFVYVVIDDNGKMIGLITDRDIFDKINVRRDVVSSERGMDEDEDPWSWTGMRNFVQYAVQKNMVEIPSTPLSEVMVREPKVTYRTSKLKDAIQVLLDGNFNQIPVLSANGKPSGMLYDLDIMRLFV
ncbi:MAG: CBS domain-containing protein [Candidatus Thermoplasmatota archaeon]|nr:CBS domain-containing protein [Candidatus Thermoplasmatota archaeon]